jgi:hypothetical protein
MTSHDWLWIIGMALLMLFAVGITLVLLARWFLVAFWPPR